MCTGGVEECSEVMKIDRLSNSFGEVDTALPGAVMVTHMIGLCICCALEA